MTADRPEAESDPLLQEAFDWLIRVQTAPEDAALRRALDDWKTTDERHAEAWRRATRVWDLVGEVPPDIDRWPAAPATAAVRPRALRAPARPRRRRAVRRIATAASTALAACLIVALWSVLQPHLTADHATGIGESRQITLDDGSVIHLGGDSAIRTDYDGARRHVRLLEGQAFFQVTPDRDRPFVVSTDKLDVTVLGTAFDVQAGERHYAVSVAHGTVAVSYRDTVDEQLHGGQQLRISRADGTAAIDAISPDNVAAWRRGRLFVNDRTVADVVETLERYYSGRILIVDDDLATRRVTGSYNLRDIDLALTGLVQPHHGQILEITPFLRILRNP